MKIDLSKFRGVKNIFRKVSLVNFKKTDSGNIKKLLYSPYLYLSLGIFIGFFITIQIKNESSRPRNPVLFNKRLIDVRNEYKEKNQSINDEIKNVQKEIKTKEDSLDDKDIVSSGLLDSLSEQELILGTTVVSGQGVEITISDGEYQIKDEFSKSLTHASDIRDIVNLLWYGGAEAISVNNERIVYNTSIDCIVSTVMINSNNYVPPFKINAIGNKYELANLINNSRKLDDIKKRANKKQIGFNLIESDNIKIEKYNGFYLKS